jgi:hypothetical protein
MSLSRSPELELLAEFPADVFDKGADLLDRSLQFLGRHAPFEHPMPYFVCFIEVDLVALGAAKLFGDSWHVRRIAGRGCAGRIAAAILYGVPEKSRGEQQE